MTIIRAMLEVRSDIENPLKPLTDASLVAVLGGQPVSSGVTVNETSAMRFIAIYRAVALVSGAIASLPLQAFREGPEHQMVRSTILERPHPEMTAMELWETSLAHLLLWGNCFLALARNDAGIITYLEPIAPEAIEVRRVTKSADRPGGKAFRVHYTDGTERELGPYEILHIPGPGYDGLKGLSPIGAARQGIGLGIAAEEYGARLFGSGSLASGILETDQKLDEPAATALKTRWQQKVAGLSKSHEIAVLDSGAKFHQLTIPPEDAQFIQSRKFQVTEIARLYGIPPHLLGDVEGTTSWGTGIEQQSIGFVTYTLRPWLTRLEQRLSWTLLPRGTSCQFQTDALTLGDAKTRMEAAQLAIQNAVKSPNEVRKDVGLAPREGGDRYIMPLQFQVLGPDGLPAGAAPAPTGSSEPAPTGASE